MALILRVNLAPNFLLLPRLDMCETVPSASHANLCLRAWTKTGKTYILLTLKRLLKVHEDWHVRKWSWNKCSRHNLNHPARECLTLANRNSNAEEIKSRLRSGNACYHSVQNLLFSRLLYKNLKVKIYRTKILPVVLYGCETWSLTLREETKLRVFENMVLRRIFGPRVTR